MPGKSSLVGNGVVALLLAIGCSFWYASQENPAVVFVESSQYSQHEKASAPTVTPQQDLQCESGFQNLFPIASDLESIPLMVHYNGDPEPCGEATIGTFVKVLKQNYVSVGCPSKIEKYEFESFLTKSLYQVLGDECPSEEEYSDPSLGFLGHCDMGEDHTPILLDHDKLVPVVSNSGQAQSLPCHFHTREGLRITQSEQLSELVASLKDAEPDCEGDETTQTCVSPGVHLYSVPAGRMFMFAPSYVGELFHLPHVPGASNKPIQLEVISLEPRVFDIYNFFNREESKELVDRAIAEKSETHRIKRSTTGASEKAVNSRRTSESGFDTNGKTALKIKRRCFSALGFDEYIESHSDGLQILRYNVSKAYNSHLDWIEDKSGQLKHDYESGGTGGNRFATILLYMSDLGENDGGETVFPYGEPTHIPEEERITKEEALQQLRSSENGSVLKQGSWEEHLVATCRSQLSVRPHSSRAVLFYSQYPNGEVDEDSLHGACPVLNSQKYAANLWVWNTPRTGFAGAPIKKKFRDEYGGVVDDQNDRKVNASFENSGKDPSMSTAELFYENTFWGKLGTGDPALHVNTFESHVWNVKVNGKIVKTWIIKAKDGKNQKFVV